MSGGADYTILPLKALHLSKKISLQTIYTKAALPSGRGKKVKDTPILEYAKKSDFKTAATKFSISNSSSKGGEIGWVKETLLSKSLNDILSKMNNGEISKSIKNPNGYLILKVNDKREMKQVINFKKELNDLVNFEKNRQLNQFSLLFYKKLKQNIKINEY